MRRRRVQVSECRKGPPLRPTPVSTDFALALLIAKANPNSAQIWLSAVDRRNRIKFQAVVGWMRCVVSASQHAAINNKEECDGKVPYRM